MHPPQEIFETHPLKSFSNLKIIQHIASYGHDISQVILLNLGYIFCLYSCHRIYLQIGVITQVLITDEGFSFDSLNSLSSIFSPNFESLCRQLTKMQAYVDTSLGWFVLIAIPSSILIPMIQLYKVLVGFDTDLYYSQWEAGSDTMVYLVRIWTLATFGYLIHSQVIVTAVYSQNNFDKTVIQIMGIFRWKKVIKKCEEA